MKTKLTKMILSALAFACALVAVTSLFSVQPAQAGYTVTLQEVGSNVVATGSGAIDLTGLTFVVFRLYPAINPHEATIVTGLPDSFVDLYDSGASGPTSFGSSPVGTSASSGSGDKVGIVGGHTLAVPTGYVSGSALSDRATYSDTTVASLGVTPGTYVWTWGTGANQNFTLQIPTPPPGPPVAITNPATLIASFSTTLNGSVNPHGLTTSVYFQYGTTTGYGLTTAPQSRTGNTFLNISAHISGLTASTTYHFRIVTTNSAGTRYGSDETFTTLPPTGFPIVTTKPATNVATFAATLNGLLDPHGLTTNVRFQYGTTTNYGHHTAMQSQTGNTYRNIAAAIGGLAGNTTYHFRIVATNSVGTRYGNDRTFTTQ